VGDRRPVVEVFKTGIASFARRRHRRAIIFALAEAADAISPYPRPAFATIAVC
jgi:hypothetical protein